jgi:hypothetical protein
MNLFSKYLFILTGLVLIITSCEKNNDKPITLAPIDTNTISMQVNIGVNYDTMVFVHLSSGTMYSSAIKNYDLAFEASEQGAHVYLNTGKYMFAWKSTSTNLFNTDTTGIQWQTDADNLLADSTVFGNCMPQSLNSLSQVVVVDRGKLYHTGSDRYRKIQIVSIDNNGYSIRFSKLNNSDYFEFVVPKNSNYALVYFSFDNGGRMVNMAPPSNQWDIVFTRYIHTYWDQPLQFRYYSVNGALTNIWNNTTCAILKKDSLPNYIPFETFSYSSIPMYPFSSEGNKIGFEWKYFDFNDNKYYITPDMYFIVNDANNHYYKIKFYDFYNTTGTRGYPAFYYQRIL